MSESGGMNVNRLTAGGQNVATDVKGNITTLPANLRPAGATTAMNLTWDSDNKLRSADIDATGTADVNFQYDALGRRVARTGTGVSVVYVQMDQQTTAEDSRCCGFGAQHVVDLKSLYVHRIHQKTAEANHGDAETRRKTD